MNVSGLMRGVASDYLNLSEMMRKTVKMNCLYINYYQLKKKKANFLTKPKRLNFKKIKNH